MWVCETQREYKIYALTHAHTGRALSSTRAASQWSFLRTGQPLVRVYLSVRMCVCVCIYIHTRIHTYIYACTHAYIKTLCVRAYTTCILPPHSAWNVFRKHRVWHGRSRDVLWIGSLWSTDYLWSCWVNWEEYLVVCMFLNRVPRTAENFRCFCTGQVSDPKDLKPVGYKDTIFHRIMKGCVRSTCLLIHTDLTCTSTFI